MWYEYQSNTAWLKPTYIEVTYSQESSVLNKLVQVELYDFLASNYRTQSLLSVKACPHSRRKARLSQKMARQRRQSHFPATVWTGLKKLACTWGLIGRLCFGWRRRLYGKVLLFWRQKTCARFLHKFLAQDSWSCGRGITSNKHLIKTVSSLI